MAPSMPRKPDKVTRRLPSLPHDAVTVPAMPAVRPSGKRPVVPREEPDQPQRRADETISNDPGGRTRAKKPAPPQKARPEAPHSGVHRGAPTGRRGAADIDEVTADLSRDPRTEGVDDTSTAEPQTERDEGRRHR
jgi:hypothetical protein